MRTTEVCAVVSGKGGVGKSTLTFFLANILAGGKNRSIILDFNSGFRSIDVFFRAEKEIVYDISDVLAGRCLGYNPSLINCVYNPNLYAIAAPADPFFGFDFESTYVFLNKLKEDFNYIFIDSPTSIGRGFISALSLCDRAIISTTPDPLSVSCATKVAEYATNADTSLIQLIINGVNFDSKQPPLISNFDDIIDTTGVPLLGVVPFYDRVYDMVMKNMMVPKSSLFSKAMYSIAKRYNNEDIALQIG